MCHGSKLIYYLGRTNLTNSPGKKQLELPCDQVVHLETAQICCASWHQANNFFPVFSLFWLGGITKHSMNGPTGNSEFCFPSTSLLRFLEKKTSLFPEGPVIQCFAIPPNSKVEKKKLGRNCLLCSGWLTNLPQFQGARPDYMQVKSSCCCFPRELVRFVRPR